MNKKIFFDLSDINELTTDAILYILSYIEYNRSNFHRANISGNEPYDQLCKEILRTSGFFKYVYSSGPAKLKSDPNIYSIESGSMVFPQKAAEVKKFSMGKLLKKESADTKSIYTTIIECMANTKHHAYKIGSIYSKWWIMASFDQQSKKVHFTFLDNGLGIPTTIRKNFREKVKALLSGFTSTGQDGYLINSALMGEFRTRTGETYRGKGLPRIYETYKEGKISDLIIISKKGYVNKTKEEAIELKETFYGTLLSWDFI